MNRNTIEYPQPYKVMNGWLYREIQSSRGAYDKPLCNFLPYIVREVTLDDGAETSKRLLLSGVKCTGEPLPEVEISGTELSSFNWVMEHWGADCVLEVGSNVKDHVRYAIQQTAADAERSTVYTVTGWKKIDGAWHYLLPGERYSCRTSSQAIGAGKLWKRSLVKRWHKCCCVRPAQRTCAI